MTITDRRTFITGAAAAAGAMATSGCRSFAVSDNSFYGPTVRDRLWMWGHHVDTAQRAGSCAKDKALRNTFKWKGPAVDQAEGCRLMGIPNNCVIRWCNLPKYPWGDYFDQFKAYRGVADRSGCVWHYLPRY